MTLSNIQIQRLIENGSKNEFSLKLIAVAKIIVASRNETWLLMEIDPENSNVAYGLCKPDNHFSFLSHINLDSPFETDHNFEAIFTAEHIRMRKCGMVSWFTIKTCLNYSLMK